MHDTVCCIGRCDVCDGNRLALGSMSLLAMQKLAVILPLHVGSAVNLLRLVVDSKLYEYAGQRTPQLSLKAVVSVLSCLVAQSPVLKSELSTHLSPSVSHTTNVLSSTDLKG